MKGPKTPHAALVGEDVCAESPLARYVPPGADEPLDAVQEALLRLLMDVFGDEICAELAAEAEAQDRDLCVDRSKERSR